VKDHGHGLTIIIVIRTLVLNVGEPPGRVRLKFRSDHLGTQDSKLLSTHPYGTWSTRRSTGGIIICTPTIPTYGGPPCGTSCSQAPLYKGISTFPEGAQYFEW